MVSVFCKHRLAIFLAFVAPFSILSGVAQTVAASPTSLSFGNVVLGTASSKKNIVLKNGQSTSIAISGITLSPSDYTQTNNCPITPATLAAGTSHDILIEDMNPTLYTGSNQVAQISSSFTVNPPLNNVSLDHITVLNHSTTGNIFVVGSQPTNPQPTMGRATITNSIFFTAKYPVWSTGSPSVCAVDGQPLKTFTGCFSSFNVTDNLVVGYNAPGTQQWGPWPAGNAFPVDPNTVFINYNGGSGGDYHVAAPYQGAGLDGKDIGADINTIGNNADTAK